MAVITYVLTSLVGLALLALPLLPSVRVDLRRMLRRAYPGSITANGIARILDWRRQTTSRLTVVDALVVLVPLLALPLLLVQTRPILPTLGLGVVLLLLTLFDLRYRWLPDTLTLPLLPAGILLAALLDPAGHAGLYSSTFGLVMAGGSVWFVGWMFRRLRGIDGIGGGDIKLIAGIGAWLGPSAAATAIATASLAALGVEVVAQLAITGSVDSRRRIPFGVYLAGAFWLLWCGHDHIGP